MKKRNNIKVTYSEVREIKWRHCLLSVTKEGTHNDVVKELKEEWEKLGKKYGFNVNEVDCLRFREQEIIFKNI